MVGPGRNSALTRRWLDILALMAVLALVARIGYLLTVDRTPPPPMPVAGTDLPAFTVLQSEHMPELQGAADTARTKLFGRYLTRPVRKGAPVRAAELGPPTMTTELLAGRWFISLQLTPGAAPDSLRAGDIADLLLSPAGPQGGIPALVQRVPVLAVSGAGEGMRVVVAVDRGQLDALAPRLGTSRIFVLKRGPAAPATARDSVPAPADSTVGGG
ncbi:MAG TPA: hypothetical protein VGB92_07415 [Longimicrobium sp.]